MELWGHLVITCSRNDLELFIHFEIGNRKRETQFN